MAEWITIALGVGLLGLLAWWFIASRLPRDADIDQE